MDRIRIRGGRPLKGSVPISGAKNAALPLMAAALLSEGELSLRRVPRLADIATMAALLGQHGVQVLPEAPPSAGPLGQTLRLNAANILSTRAPYDIVRKMRASVLVLGPLLARMGRAEVSLPGGCAIGTRPVDLHIAGLAKLGASIELVDGYIRASAPGGLKGAVVRLPKVSVGATENLLMAASLAKGTTVLENAAREPEIADLAHCLVAMGARIDGIGSDLMTIEGVPTLRGADYSVMPDRIECGTYAVAAAITGGELLLDGARAELMESTIGALVEAGAEVASEPAGLRVRGRLRPRPGDITTAPYPGFATDMQAQMMALAAVAEGASVLTETIFENRFMHVPELLRLGADIRVSGAAALVRGVDHLVGAPVMATDLRASVSLVLAGLVARGETIVNRIYHLDRGYERLEAKLVACGADIERFSA
ncbi:MAG: UDP-N-acetylglucosamine 1-carboxyvinyltransferase [Alphaproteobacteria bacterium]|nr:UDP-N-acetylglucosamine 1-carboxyvinyltransferase [Alphaproteobacteria bacterium]